MNNIKAGIMAGFIGAVALTAHGAETEAPGKYIVKLDSEKPYVAFITGGVSYSICKIMNEQEVYIAVPGAKIPGTGEFDYLNKDQINSILVAPDCNPNIKRVQM